MGRVADDLIAWAEPWLTSELETEVDRVNLAANPKAGDLTIDEWAGGTLATFEAVQLGTPPGPGGNATLNALGLTRGFHGIGDAANDRARDSVDVVAGQPIYFSTWVFLSSNTATGVALRVRSSVGGTIKATSPTLSTIGPWTRLEIAIIADSTGTWTFAVEQIGAGDTDFYWTGVLIEAADELGDYFDGDTDPATTRWAGDPNLSASELYTVGDPLRDYLRAAGSMFAQVEELAFDTDEFEGWTILLDPDRAPAYALPYLAQFVGERLPTGLELTDEALAREWIKDAPNSRRGTIESIVRTAQRTLTGQRTVVIHERNPDEDSLVVHTLTSETPDSQVVERDLRADAVPADIVLDYSTITGQTYNDLNLAVADYDEMDTEWPTYNAAAAAQPAGTTYTRPPP